MAGTALVPQQHASRPAPSEGRDRRDGHLVASFQRERTTSVTRVRLGKGIGGVHGVQISGQNLLIGGRNDFLADTPALSLHRSACHDRRIHSDGKVSRLLMPPAVRLTLNPERFSSISLEEDVDDSDYPTSGFHGSSGCCDALEHAGGIRPGDPPARRHSSQAGLAAGWPHSADRRRKT